MKKRKEPELLCPRKPGRRAATVLRVSLFRRAGSRYYQVRIRLGKLLKRLSTGRTLRAAAEEYAALAYQHFSRASREHGHTAAMKTVPPDPSQPDLPLQ